MQNIIIRGATLSPIITLNEYDAEASFHYKNLDEEEYISLRFIINENINLPPQANISYQGATFYLSESPRIRMINSKAYEYSLIFKTAIAKAHQWKIINLVDRRIRFDLTAKAKEHLQLITNNLNLRGAKAFKLGSSPDTEEKLITYDNTNIFDALGLIAEAFSTEWHYDKLNGSISLGRLEIMPSESLSLSYGSEYGLCPDIIKESDSNAIISRLWVQGGDRNIDKTKYRSPNLLLPKSIRLSFDGKVFQDQSTDFNQSLAKIYESDAEGFSIIARSIDEDISNEDSLDLSKIYPARVGLVSSSITKDAEKHFYDFIDDSISERLNYEDYLIEGTKMTVLFQSGMLASREFEVQYIHKERLFRIVPKEIDGIMMPNEDFHPEKGDKYIVLNIALPKEYIADYNAKTGASFEMMREAIRHLHKTNQKTFDIKAKINPNWAERNWQRIAPFMQVGAFISYQENRLISSALKLRVSSVKTFFARPYSPEIKLTNGNLSYSNSSALRTIKNEISATAKQSREAFAFAKRSFSDAVETSEKLISSKLQGFTDKIKPIAIETMQLIAGSEQSQFVFLDPDTHKQRSISIRFDKNRSELLLSPRLLLQHKTYKQKEISPNKNFYSWLVNETTLGIKRESPALYLYAIASKENQDTPCSLLLSEEALDFETSENLNCLIGILSSPNEEGDRSFAPLYGYSEILGGRITTDRIVSADGSTSFDLQEGLISGNIKFLDPNGETILGREKGETSISGGLVLSNVIALKDDANEVRAYLDGNTKHKTAFSAGVQNAFTPNEKANIVIAHDGSARFGLMNISPTAKIFLGESEDKAFMELGHSKTNINDKLNANRYDIELQRGWESVTSNFSPPTIGDNFVYQIASELYLGSFDVRRRGEALLSFNKIEFSVNFDFKEQGFFSSNTNYLKSFSEIKLYLVKDNNREEIEITNTTIKELRGDDDSESSAHYAPAVNITKKEKIDTLQPLLLSAGHYEIKARVIANSGGENEYNASTGSITTSVGLEFSGLWNSGKKEISITDKGLLYFLDRHNYFIINTEKGNGLPFIKARGDIDIDSNIAHSFTLRYEGGNFICTKHFRGAKEGQKLKITKIDANQFAIEGEGISWSQQEFFQVNWAGYYAFSLGVVHGSSVKTSILKFGIRKVDNWNASVPEGLEMSIMLIRNRN